MTSDELLARALAAIPGGAQTDTKTVSKRLVGIQPSFFVRGKGAYAQDPDGIWWLDCQMGLGAYILGYCDPLVNRKVASQLRRGSIFSLASVIELEVAEQLLGIFPEFENVRFTKNGSDVTSAAVRISRSYTGRQHVIGCGYHGFQDWSMSLRSGITGVPDCVRELTDGQEEVDLQKILAILDANPTRFAAVIVDIAGSGLPDVTLLRELRAKCSAAGTILIFDEIVSGFRAGLRGVVGLSGVVPDMLCLGKALANGFPLAALLGSGDLLSLAPSAGMTATFAGDCIALAAAQATLEQLRSGRVYANIEEVGSRLLDAVKTKIVQHGVSHLLYCYGYPGLVELAASKGATHGEAAARWLMREFAGHRIFWQGSFVLCRDFGEKELTSIASALEDSLPRLAQIDRTEGLKRAVKELDRLEQKYLKCLPKRRRRPTL